jgi:hypothetical protein
MVKAVVEVLVFGHAFQTWFRPGTTRVVVKHGTVAVPNIQGKLASSVGVFQRRNLYCLAVELAFW